MSILRNIHVKKSQALMIDEFIRFLERNDNARYDIAGVAFNKRKVYVTVHDSTDEKVEDDCLSYRTCDFLWEQVINMTCVLVSQYDGNPFFFRQNENSKDISLQIVTKDKVYDLYEIDLATITAIDKLGMGAMAQMNMRTGEYYGYNYENFIPNIIDITKEDLLETKKSLYQDANFKHPDKQLFISSIISDEMNFRMARFFSDYRLARTKCKYEVGSLGIVAKLEFKVKTRNGVELRKVNLKRGDLNDILFECEQGLIGHNMTEMFHDTLSKHNLLVDEYDRKMENFNSY